jgi:hypothetical protein
MIKIEKGALYFGDESIIIGTDDKELGGTLYDTTIEVTDEHMQPLRHYSTARITVDTVLEALQKAAGDAIVGDQRLVSGIVFSTEIILQFDEHLRKEMSDVYDEILKPYKVTVEELIKNDLDISVSKGTNTINLLHRGGN